jgi:hypothetical protein
MGKAHLIGHGKKCLVPPEGKDELKGRDARENARKSINKAHAKGRNNKAAKAPKGLTRFTDNQGHNELANRTEHKAKKWKPAKQR